MTDVALKKKSLGELTVDVLYIEEELLQNGGALSEEMEKELLDLEKTIAVKADNYYFRMKMMSHRADGLKARGKEFIEAGRDVQNYVDALHDNIKKAMIRLKKSEIVGSDVKFKLKSTKPKMLIDEKLLPKHYLTEIISVVPDKILIAEEVKKEIEIPGVTFEQGYSLNTYVNSGK